MCRKPIFIRAYNAVVIQDITVDINDIDDHDMWEINLKVFFDKNDRENISGLLITELKTDGVTVEVFTPIEIDLTGDDIFVNERLKINKVKNNRYLFFQSCIFKIFEGPRKIVVAKWIWGSIFVRFKSYIKNKEWK